jgi:hypothetical protein
MMLRTRRVMWTLSALAAAGLVAGLAVAQTIQRDSFDGAEVQGARGQANVPFSEEAHILTNQHAHSLPTSEYIRIKADANGVLNPFVNYDFATSPAPIIDDMTCRIWVRASRPGVQLLVRVVLPRERNVDKPTEPMTLMLRGEAYKTTEGFWQALELRRPAKLLKDEQQTLRTKLQRDINIDGAYADRVMLNLYTGPGVTEAWVDDLEIGPVIEQPVKGQTPAQTTSRANVPAQPPTGVTPVPPPGATQPKSTRVPVEFNRDQLYVGGRKFLMRGVRYSNTPIKTLRDAGLNSLFVGDKMDPAVYEEAVREGFWLVPSLPSGVPDPEVVTREVSRFAADDAVLFWYLGADVRYGQFEGVARTAQAVRSADPNRPLALDAWDGLPIYSRQVDLLSAHRFPLMTSLELPQYRDWLNSRRQLDKYGSYFWTWVQTHLQDWFVAAAYPEVDNAKFEEPIGPQAEQIRLLTYLALSAGCKGLGFWSDRFLADSHQGRDRLLTLALLNQELQMLEPLVLGVVDTPVWIDTSVPDVKAAVLRCDRGVLVLPMWLGRGAQFVPGQSAATTLTMTIPMVPTGAQAWSVSPGEVKALSPPMRVVGGSKISVAEFDVTAAIVFTSDNSPTGLLVRWQDQARRMQKMAAQWSYDLAGVEIAKVEKIQVQLRALNREPSDAKALLAKANQYLIDSKAAWDANDFPKAYHDAQRALRPVRILMRAEWDEAVKSLGPDAPLTASPYAVSFYTLPKHWRFRAQLEQCSPAGNKLAEGDFEQAAGLPSGWREQRLTPEEVEGDVKITGDGPHGGKSCLMIQVRQKVLQAAANGAAPIPITALEPTYLAVTSPPVQLPPGSLVRVSGWVKVPVAIAASADGALVFDSAGGEPLGLRLTAATKGWQRFTLFRRVPANGTVQITAALTGIGTAYFDDLAIEPLNSK